MAIRRNVMSATNKDHYINEFWYFPSKSITIPEKGKQAIVYCPSRGKETNMIQTSTVLDVDCYMNFKTNNSVYINGER